MVCPRLSPETNQAAQSCFTLGTLDESLLVDFANPQSLENSLRTGPFVHRVPDKKRQVEEKDDRDLVAANSPDTPTLVDDVFADIVNLMKF